MKIAFTQLNWKSKKEPTSVFSHAEDTVLQVNQRTEGTHRYMDGENDLR